MKSSQRSNPSMKGGSASQGATTGTSRWVPTVCYQCNQGPDLARILVVDGVAAKVDGNIAFEDMDASGARVCVKAYGLIQKLYNPNRVRAPLRRTNPLKGKDQDPGWEEISWDEALDQIASKFKEVRRKGLLDENGYPRVAMTLASGALGFLLCGTLLSLAEAWGPVDHGLGSGEGIRCAHSEHTYGEFWHRSFVCSADPAHCNYVICIGSNANAATAVASIRQQADARARGQKWVQIEPQLSVTAATADEWIPIRPKTDAALLYAMVHVILHELHRWDGDYLKTMTNSPYLIGADGDYARDPESQKPLVWDTQANCPRPFDSGETGDYALEGAFLVQGTECPTAFEALRRHMTGYTPEWAARITGVEATTIRRLATELVENAMIGSTIEMEGVKVPYRPVCVLLGSRGTNTGVGAYQALWANHVLQVLVGGLEVPGGHVGALTVVDGPVVPGPDGFFERLTPLGKPEAWQWPPGFRDAWASLTPLNPFYPGAQILGASHLAWLNLVQPKEGWPAASLPDIWITFKANPAVSQSDTEMVLKAMAKVPFHVSIAYTLDETNHFADVVLPENGDLESWQLVRVGGVNKPRVRWEQVGMGLRQPVVDPPFNTKELTDIATELAQRIGILSEYHEAINRGLGTFIPLKTPFFDLSLDADRTYSCKEITDRHCRAATLILSHGREEHDLAWYKEHGAYLVAMPKFDGIMVGPKFWRPWYLHRVMKQQGLRWELPYQGRLKSLGEDLGQRLHAAGVRWWDDQLNEYQALPEWRDFSSSWDTGPEYDLWLISSRSMQFAFGANVAIPAMIEAAELVLGHSGVMINRSTAAERGIKNGDEIWIESPVGRVKGKAVLREGVHPEVVVMTHKFGHWKTPVAKDLGWPSMNPITPSRYDLTVEDGSTSDHVRVKAYKAL